MMILKLEETGDLEEISRKESLQHNKWISGSLYDDINDVFHLDIEDESQDEAGNVLMFLLAAEGGLKVCPVIQVVKCSLFHNAKANLSIRRFIDHPV